ncbi:Uncharacterised protein [Leclercia adecarboxylata]|uniref:Uncharacterized protein n=1 Tax=Leclercia adecarboxylata TaxID=83655 RepID=A0A4U9HXA1_9ENTR|nr:Uncharacterised protein [Leclercia adecarboxylata]
MLKDNFNDLLSFMVVARERSFTAQRPNWAYRSQPSATPCVTLKHVLICAC